MDNPASNPHIIPPKPFQYRLWHLFVVMTVLAVLIGAFSQLGSYAIYAILAGGGLVLVIYSAVRREMMTAIIGILLMGAVLLFLPAVGSGRVSRRFICSTNLKQIGLALELYHDLWKSYPPAYVADKNGKPMHSWRVLILPQLEQQALYDRYRFDEPWDGPNNRKLAELVKNLDVYSCPAQTPGDLVGETSYVVVIGPHTAFPGEKCIARKDITDGLANTLMVVEVHHSGIHWMEPRDLHVLQMSPAINAKSGQGISSAHKKGVEVVAADISVHFLPDESTTTELLRALLTIDGNEIVEFP